MKNNKWIIALLIVLLFIPTYIAVANYISLSSTPVTVDKASALSISDPIGIVYEETTESSVAKLLEKINKNAIELSTPPESLSSANYFKVTYKDGNRSTEYRYFFSLNTSSVYYTDKDGIAYLVGEEDAAEFLETKYAQCLYSEAYLPTLTNGENVLVPSEYEWAFKTAGGSNMGSNVAKTTSEKVAYTGRNGLEFNFTRQPYTFNVDVKCADGELLYSGDYSGLAGAVDTKKHSVLEISANAQWLGNDEHMSSGTAKYNFILNIEAATEFFITLSASGADAGNDYIPFIPGDVAMLSATGIKDASKITFKSEPVLTHGGKEITPKFYLDGTTAYAFLPTAYDTASGEYSLVFGYEGVNYALSLTVEEKKFGTNVYDVTKAVADATRNAQTLATYDNLVKEVASGALDTAYFDGSAFGTGVSKSNDTGYSVKAGYGRTQTVKPTNEKFQLDGIEYYLKEGSDIYAVMGGKVVAATTTAYAGNVVAVDHGYGIISWYHNLSQITASKGDVVAKGDVVGKSGSTGFTKGGLAYIGLTVFDVPVCAYDFIWGSGISFN
ncbi:MAG: M23 family metallopeptidase [Clostridia bacterium]|nr:M23 family metallopeptidase [Clostridia bacterium]